MPPSLPGGRAFLALVLAGVSLLLGWPEPLLGSTADHSVLPERGLAKIQHLVFIMQENRSFDSYFGTYPGVDGLPPDVCLPDPAGGPCVAPYHDPSDVNHGGPHDDVDAIADVDGGRMDGFVVVAARGARRSGGHPCSLPVAVCEPRADPHDVMGWHDAREIPNYWNYAHLFVLQDHLFSSVGSFTLPNRLYALGAQSGGLLSHRQPQPRSFDFPLITDLLTASGVDWRFYVTIGRHPNPTDGHVLGTGSPLDPRPDEFSYFNPLPAFPHVVDDPEQRWRLVDTAQFYDDARTGQLPQVCWIAPSEPVSEHPPSSIRDGMAYVTGLVNAVMDGPAWESTAIFVGYDEWGGFYDHVPPPIVDGQVLGLRVPGLVISPYAKIGYVDHHVYTPVSWLRLIEERFDLPPLTARDAHAGDMLDAFDFDQPPRPPVLLAATRTGTPYPVALPVPNERGGSKSGSAPSPE